MKTPRIGTSLWHLLVVGLVTLAPCVAHAGLTGDTVTASLTDVESGTTIFSGSAPVSGSTEFTGNFGPLLDRGNASSWTLDLTDTGFTLTGVCPSGLSSECPFILGLTLSISDLDFTPPANLVALSPISGALANPLFAGAPQITASSVVIEFQDVELGSNTAATSTYAATFVTEPRAEVPLPATVVLLAIGALTVSRRRFRGRV